MSHLSKLELLTYACEADIERIRKALAEALEQQKATATVGVNVLVQIACSVAVSCGVKRRELLDLVEKCFDICEQVNR